MRRTCRRESPLNVHKSLPHASAARNRGDKVDHLHISGSVVVLLRMAPTAAGDSGLGNFTQSGKRALERQSSSPPLHFTVVVWFRRIIKKSTRKQKPGIITLPPGFVGLSLVSRDAVALILLSTAAERVKPGSDCRSFTRCGCCCGATSAANRSTPGRVKQMSRYWWIWRGRTDVSRRCTSVSVLEARALR